MEQEFFLKVYRGSPGSQYWETFSLKNRKGLNVIAALMEIRKYPMNSEGKKVSPVVWEDGCLEEVCGSCSMLVNGKPRQACSAIISSLLEKNPSSTITLAPLSKFPLVRDLIVDRSIMFENLKRVRGWIETDGLYDKGPGPKVAQKKQEVMYTLSTCMTCGCCSEACPQVNENSPFMGPAPLSQVRLFNLHPHGGKTKKERLKALMEEGGVADCGNAQNCTRVCPKKIPLTDSIAAMSRETSLQMIKDWFALPED